MKVLIVEDDPVSRHLLETFLREWGYDARIATNGTQAWDILQEPASPNLIISDWLMSGMNGIELCSMIRKKEKSEYTYFILLTTKNGKEDVIEGLRAGADDFIVKPFAHEELKFRLKIGERILKLERDILKLARTDALTGLMNRGAFMERAEQEFQRSCRENTLLSLIMIDIDHFKKINDRYGHQVGDFVLQEFADQIKKISRPYDVTARYGGEEFAVVLSAAGSYQSRLIAERMRKQVAEMKIKLPLKSQPIRISASFGTASFLPVYGESLDSLIKQADEALYRAKRKGRNCVCSAGVKTPYKRLPETSCDAEVLELQIGFKDMSKNPISGTQGGEKTQFARDARAF